MTKEIPFFSIIIPTYNRAYIISKTVNSVVNQSFTDWELIVVDDGSTDNTAEIIKEFNDKRIHYFWKKNEERSIARNFGIKKAAGTYLCFLDSDDSFLPNHLQELKKEIDRQKEPVAIFRTGIIYEKRGKKTFFPNYEPDSKITPVQFAWYNPITLLSMTFHKNICQKFTFPEHYQHFEDYYFLLNVLSNFPLFQIPIYTTTYFYHESSSSSNDSLKDNSIFLDELNWLKNIFQENDPKIKEYITPKMQKEGVARQYLRGANIAFYQKKFKEGIHYFYLAITTKISVSILKNYAYTFALFWSRLLFSFPKGKD